jgi:transcription elongation factor GreA
MRDEFEKMVAAGKLEQRHVDALAALTDSGFCTHRSWGFGRIKSVDTVFARFTIDFPGKQGHTMDLAFAAENLKPISKDHILARKAADIEGLRQLAGKNHLELIKLVVNSFGGKATLDQIQQVLVPDVIRDDWKKWWESAKHELKKDGHFQVPTKKTEPIVYQATEVSLDQRLLSDFRAAKGLKARITIASEVLKNAADLTDKQAVANEVIKTLNGEVISYQRTQPAVALEAIFIRDDLRDAAGVSPIEGELSAQAIWSQDVRIGKVLEELPAAKHRRILDSFKASNPNNWHDVLLSNLNFVSAKVVKEIAGMLSHEGKLDGLKATMARLISQHAASTELLLWLAKDRSDVFADILGPEVFRAMLTAMERDQFNEKRSNKLRDAIVDDQDLIIALIGSADIDVIRDLIRALQLSPCFDDMEKRSLLGRIIKSEPAVQELISTDQEKKESHFVVSWESLERRKNEYHELVHKKIPANSKEIAIARSYGDLRENHEYKSAKEQQKLLMKRKGELEQQLVRARGTDFSSAKGDVVGIGTEVRVTDLAANQPEQFTILGAWDSDPDRNVVSYLTPLAQALMNHKPGEEVEFQMEQEKRRFRIESIAPVKKPEPTAIAEVPSSEPAPQPA